MWEKGGNFYGLHGSIQRTHHVFFQWFLQSRHTLCRYQRIKFYPLSISDEALKSSYEQYPVTICGQTIILTNGELAEALLSRPEKKREIIYLYFFGNYTQQEIADLYGQCKSTAWHYIHSALQMLQEEMEVLLHGES
jgi:DNA-directed RNA polymerase specialized sigma24 family protein